SLRLGIGHALGNRCRDRLIDGPVSKLRQEPSDLLERQLAGEITERYCKGKAVPPTAEPRRDTIAACRHRKRRSSSSAILDEAFDNVAARLNSLAQKWRMVACALQRFGSAVSQRSPTHGPFSPIRRRLPR